MTILTASAFSRNCVLETGHADLAMRGTVSRPNGPAAQGEQSKAPGAGTGVSGGPSGDLQPDVQVALKSTDDLEEVLAARVTARAQHSVQALARLIDLRSECLEANRCVH